MAKFKNQDLLLDDNEQILLGDDDDASIYWDGSDLITNQLLKHSSQGYYATREFVESTVAALEWQDSVLSKSYSIPPTANDGDRYIVKASGIGDWLGHDDEIAELNTTWGFTTPSAGFACWVEDEGVYYIWNGSAWIKFGGVVDHGNLLGLADDDHTQYVLIDGTREMTGRLTIDQEEADDEILSLKSSDVSHALTSVTETDTYGFLQKYYGAGGFGGLEITAVTEDANVGVGMHLISYGGQASTGFGSGSAGLFTLDAYEHDGANSLANITATGNVFSVRAYTAGAVRAKYTLNEDGQSWQPGTFFVGSTSNANMTQGITVSQGGQDDEILALKSSDVTHGVTTQSETDTYALFKKSSASDGGLRLQTFSEANIALNIIPVATTDDTTKGTGGNAPFRINVVKKDGTSIGAVGADANLAAILNNGSARWQLDAEGDMHLDGDIMPFDADTQNIGASGSEWDTAWINTIHCDTLDATTISGSWDHGQLTGLSDDDHPIYLPTDGSRGMTGTLSVGTTGGYIKFSGTSAEIGFATDTDLLTLETGVAPSATINGDLVVANNLFINDTENTEMTIGLTINQAGNDDEILALKSSDVAHGATGQTETDTFFKVAKTWSNYGGTTITSLMEDTGSQQNLIINAYGGTATAGVMAEEGVYPLSFLTVAEILGTNVTNVTAGGWLFGIRGRTSNVNKVRWAVNLDGNTWQSGDILPNVTGTQDIGDFNNMWGNIYTDALTVSSGNITMYGDILPAASDTYDIGHSDAVWDNIWCKTLHTSAGSINLGSIALTDSSGELLVDGTAVPSLSTTQAASANAVSVAETYSNSASANAYTKSAAYTDTQVGATGVNKGYTSGSIGAVVSKDYTGISEDAVQINIHFRNVSNNNASYAPIIQLKNQSAIQTTGYESHVMTGSSNDRNNTDGIHYCNATADHAAADIYDGHLIITRMNSAGTVWAWQGNSIADAESAFRNCTGYVVLSTAFGGTVRFTSESGGATHDGGSVYVSSF